MKLPFSTLAAVVRGRLHSARKGGRRREPRVRWSRAQMDGVVRLGCDIEGTGREADDGREAVAAAVAEAAAGVGLAVGIVGVVVGEEPLLVALAPRRDIVAPRVLDALAGGATHPAKHIWLALAPGRYLASVVDPYRVFAGRDDEVAAIVRSGKAACALTTEWTRGPGGFRVALAVYSPRPGVRKLLRLARKGMEGARDRLAAR